MVGKINVKLLRSTIKKQFGKGRAKEIAYRQAVGIFNRKKAQMLSAFNNHPITRELEAGENSSNISGTLGGVEGNLYSFIGFPDGGNPVDPIRNRLESGTRLMKTPTVRISSTGTIFIRHKVTYPSIQDLEGLAPMPWEGGSWITRVERGISGLGYYIFRNFIQNSRSGSGIQANNKLRSVSYKRTSYLSKILRMMKRA